MKGAFAMKIGSQLPVELRERHVAGFNIPVGATFDDVLSEEPTLLVFLRHHG